MTRPVGTAAMALAAMATAVISSCAGHSTGPVEMSGDARPATVTASMSSSPPAGSAVPDPRTMHPVGSAAPTVTVPATLPFSWSDATVVRTGWTQLPLVGGNLFVGFAEPRSASDSLTFSAVDSYGTVRWRTERPASCTGFAVSLAGDVPVVVLTDSTAAGGGRSHPGGWTTTASGYEMAAGRLLWGPVAVAGSVQGPGLVFGSSKAATLGPGGGASRAGPRQRPNRRRRGAGCFGDVRHRGVRRHGADRAGPHAVGDSGGHRHDTLVGAVARLRNTCSQTRHGAHPRRCAPRWGERILGVDRSAHRHCAGHRHRRCRIRRPVQNLGVGDGIHRARLERGP